MHGLASQFGRPLVATVVLALLAVAVAGWRGYRARSAGGASIRPALQTLAIGSGIAVIVATALPRSLSPRRWGEGDLVLEPGRGGLADLAEGLLHPFSWAALLPLLNVAVYVPFG